MNNDVLFVDNFAGGGGASTGIEIAIGRSVDIAINHDPEAIRMHKANHPGTKHYCENVWDVDPVEACGGKPVALAWFSPDCTHFSRAKGGKPVDKNIRGLAWVTIRWAAMVRPGVIMLENVPEIRTWGPLMPLIDKKTGRVIKRVVRKKHVKRVVAAPYEIVPQDKIEMVPDPAKSGETFEAFILALTTGLPKTHPAFREACTALGISFKHKIALQIERGLGYNLDYRILKSCDYGAPTSRQRFYMIARSDGRPIVWPKPTHASKDSEAVKRGECLPYRTAAECIDWSIEPQSIFERKKPLAENTLRRIARGIEKFVINNPEPFIVTVNHSGDGFRGQSVDKPLDTVTAKNGYGVVVPHIVNYKFENPPQDIDKPLTTVTSVGNHYLVAPSIVPVGYGEREGQKPRVNDITEPLGTVVGSGKHYLVAPTLIQYHSETAKDEVRGQKVDEPIMTVDTAPRYALSVAHIMKNYGGGYKGAGSDVEKPLPTVTGKDHNSLVTAHVVTLRNNMDGQKIDEPLSTVSCSGAHHAEVQAFLVKYFATGTAKGVDEPLDTVTSKDRFALVTIHGERYVIVDIKMRMLQPHELFKAQGFPDDYIIDVDVDGNKITKTEQTAKCGNAVTPQVPAALVRANLPEYCTVEQRKGA